VFVSTNYHALVRARRYYIELSENSSRKANLQNFIRVTRFTIRRDGPTPRLPRTSNAAREDDIIVCRLMFERARGREREREREGKNAHSCFGKRGGEARSKKSVPLLGNNVDNRRGSVSRRATSEFL